jgi:hypothetical protein
MSSRHANMGLMTTTPTPPDLERELADLAAVKAAADAHLTRARERLDQAVHRAREAGLSFGRISRAIGMDAPNVHRRYKALRERQERNAAGE